MIFLSRSAKKWKAMAAKLKVQKDELADMVQTMLKKPGTLRRALLIGDLLRVEIDHPAMTWVAGMAVQYFKDSRALNYVMLDITHPDVGQMTVTVQKVKGKTPIQIIEEKDAEIERYRKAGAKLLKTFLKNVAIGGNVLLDEEVEEIVQAGADFAL